MIHLIAGIGRPRIALKDLLEGPSSASSEGDSGGIKRCILEDQVKV